MAKKLKSLNPIIGTGYKTLSKIKDGEDGNIENFPDTLPKIPRLSYKRLGVSGLEIGWEFEDKIYYTYELYGSTTKGFEASEENLMFQGLASSYFYEAKPGEKWYFKARAKNTYGRYTEFSSELVTYTVKLDNLGEYVEGGSINGALIENATINNAHIKDLHADKITAGVLDADRIGANSITANKIEANAITSEKIQANAITTDKLAANIIASNHIQSGTIESGHIKADTIESDHIKSNSINSNHIQANTIQSEHIQTGAITAGSGIIAEGAIGSAQISSLDAAKIEAGTIDTSKVTIQGADGHLRLKGNRMQVFQGTGNQAKERVSLGDVNGNGSVYGLRVRGADGTTILLDENGVKSEGITDGAITNDKISDDANIDGAKLNINSVVNKINEDGTETIQGTKIEVDGTTLNTKLSTITNKQTEDGERISQAQSQITANTNAIKLKVDEQTYTTDKRDMTSKLEKNTSEISAMKGKIALKVEQTDIENAKSEMEGVMDTKVDSAKAEIKVTTDAISQNVSNLSQTVSNKADGSTVTSLSNKVGSLETSVNGISGKVSSLETTTTTINNKANDAMSVANTAKNTADKNKTSINSINGEITTVKSNMATLDVNLQGITQRVSNTESTTSSLSTQLNSVSSTATNALNKANSANTLADSKAKIFTTTPTTPYKVGDLWVQGTSGDVMRCKTARSSGSYNSADWEKASKYTDDTKANAVDGKVTNLQAEYNNTKSQVAEIVTDLDGITQRVSNTESTTATITTDLQSVSNIANSANTNASSALNKANTATSTATTAKNTADSALTQANTNKGNITTLQGTVNTTNSKVATLETNLNGITQRVSSTESTTATLTTKVNNVESTANQAKTDASNANSNATNALNKANDASSKVDNLSIGGTNLLLKTKTFDNLRGGLSKVTETYKNLTVRGGSIPNSQTVVCEYDFTDFNLGDTFTFSFYAKGNLTNLRTYFYGANGYVQVVSGINSQGYKIAGADGNANLKITSEWQRYWVTWTLKTSGDTSVPKYILLRTDGSTVGQEVYVCGCKFEKGNKTTEWNPSPEDVQSQIDTHTTQITTTNSKVSSIETNLSGITSRVGSVESKTTTLEGKVSSQETRISNAEQKITDKAIINTVSSTIENKVNEGINKIEIGGRNYILNSKNNYIKPTGNDNYDFPFDISDSFWSNPNRFTTITLSFDMVADTPLASDYTSNMWFRQAPWYTIGSFTYPKNTIEKKHYTLQVDISKYPADYNPSQIFMRFMSKDTVGMTVSNIKMEIGTKPSDWTQAPEDVDEVLLDTEKKLNSNIDNAISDVQDNILKNVADNYASTSEFKSLSETVSSNMTQTNKNIEMQFTTAQNYTKEVDGKLQEFQNTVGTHIRFGQDGIELGKTNSPFTAKLDNTKLAFLQDNEEIAYISNNKMHITNAEIKETLRIGTSEDGYFTWIQGEKGNLSLKWSDK